MPKWCASCGKIAKTSLISGVVLFAIGYVGDLLRYGRVFLIILYFVAPLAWLVGLVAGIRGWIDKRGWLIIAVTLLNGILLAAMIAIWISQLSC